MYVLCIHNFLQVCICSAIIYTCYVAMGGIIMLIIFYHPSEYVFIFIMSGCVAAFPVDL